MTTFQDPPHQSRRAIRHSERAVTADTDVERAPEAAEQSQGEADLSTSAIPTATRKGRRVQLDPGSNPSVPVHDEVPAESDYVAQVRPQVPSYDGPSFRNLPINATGEVDLPTPVSAADVAEAAAVREPAPQGRRVSLAAGKNVDDLPVVAEPSSEAADDIDEDVVHTVAAPESEFHDADAAGEPAADDAVENIIESENAPTEAAAEPIAESVAEPTPAEAPVADVAPTALESTPEQPLTRRQLRELRAEAERAEAAQATSSVPESIETLLNSGPIILPYLNPPPIAAPTAVAGSVDETPLVAASAPQVDEPTAGDAAYAAPEVVADEVAQAEADEDIVDAEVVPDPEPEPLVEPTVISSVPGGRRAARAAKLAESGSPAPAVVSAIPAELAVPAAPAPVFIEPAPISTRAAGHWSVQPDEDEDIESVENSITRTVGASSGAVTTSALVLPSIPQSSDITGAYGATGEIMVTGSIDLPRSLSSTGAHPHRVDNSDFDVDPLDREVPSSDSAPVRAIRAVSTHTSSQGIIANRKPQSNRLLTVMVISSAVLFVAVVGLVIVGFATGLFG